MKHDYFGTHSIKSMKSKMKIHSLKTCPRCGAEVELIDNECWNCGFIFEED